MFPDARFVHIVRDVRDVVVSARHAWGVNPYRAAQRWANSVLEPSRQVAEFPNSLLEIRYEDLVTEPAKVVTQICEFLGLEFEPEMLEFKKSPENLGSTRGIRTIVANNTQKGLRELSEVQLQRIEQIACDGLTRFDYSTGYKGPAKRLPKFQMFLYRLSDGLKHLRREMSQRGIVKGAEFVFRFYLQNIKSGL